MLCVVWAVGCVPSFEMFRCHMGKRYLHLDVVNSPVYVCPIIAALR